MTAPSPLDTLAERVRGVLASYRDVREVRMFGGLSFMVDGKLAVSSGGDGSLLVRVASASYDDLLDRGGEPAYMGEGKPMGSGWLSVPSHRLEQDEELSYWVEVGITSRDAAR